MADEGEEINEINEENIKKLAAQAGAGGDEDEHEEDQEQQEVGGSESEGEQNTELELERLKTQLEMLKEQNSSASDRVQTMSQTIGEIRQMAHEQERKVSEIRADVDKLQDSVEKVEPRKIEKRLGQLESEIEDNEASMKKLEEKLQAVTQTANDAKQTLNELGSLDNLIDLNEEFDEKLSEIKEAQQYIERLAKKSEKINIQINKKMSEYNTYKSRVDALDEKSGDMFRKLDELEVEVNDAVEQSELEGLRERVKELEEQLEEYEEIAPLAQMSLPEPIMQLRQRRNNIEELLEDIEERHERGDISTAKYEKIKNANEEKLDKIQNMLIKEWNRLEEAADSDAVDQTEEQETGDETKRDREYDDLLDKTVGEIKEAVREQNYDVEAVLEEEKEGKDRSSLIEWLESKAGE